MRRLVRMSAWLVVLQLGQATVAWACSCIPLEPEGYVTSGDSIVVATIVAVREGTTVEADSSPARSSGGCAGSHRSETGITTAPENNEWPPWISTIEVAEIVAGTAGLGTTEVETNRTSASCGLDLSEGETWVLQIGADDVVSSCSASRRIDSDDDPWLEALREAAAR